MANRPKISFVGIGTNKCGSTWVYENLRKHPDICCTALKEAHFFSKNYDLGFVWYKNQFAHCQDECIRGEFSPEYIANSVHLERIKQHYPTAKLLLCVRDPKDRLKSVWRFNYGRGVHNYISFQDFLEYCPEKQWRKGLYAQNLAEVYHRFDHQQLHIILYDDIKERPNQVLKDLYTFLEVDNTFLPTNSSEKVNSSLTQQPRLRFINNMVYTLRSTLRGMDRARIIRRLTIAAKLNVLADLILKKNLKNTEPSEVQLSDALDQRMEQKLNDYYRDDVAELSTILDRDLLADWGFK